MIDGPIDLQTAMATFDTLTKRAKALSITLRSPPPEPTTCCGRGCNGCVWEGFFAAAAYWQEDALLAIQAQREPN